MTIEPLEVLPPSAGVAAAAQHEEPAFEAKDDQQAVSQQHGGEAVLHPDELELNPSERAGMRRQDTVKASAHRPTKSTDSEARQYHDAGYRHSVPRKPSPPSVRIDPYYSSHNYQGGRPSVDHSRHQSYGSEGQHSYGAAFVPHFPAQMGYQGYEGRPYDPESFTGSPTSSQSPILYSSGYQFPPNDMYSHLSAAANPMLYSAHPLSATSSSTSPSRQSLHGESPDPYLAASRGEGPSQQISPATFSSDSSSIQSPITPHTAGEQYGHQPFAYYEVPPSAFHRQGYQPSYAYARWPAFEMSSSPMGHPSVYGHSPQHAFHYPPASTPPGMMPMPLQQQRSHSFSHPIAVQPTSWLYGSPPPQPYSPPKELARGSLAQSHMHQAMYDHAGQPLPVDRKRQHGSRSAMPKPPPHSPHALWAGNVPSDATHAELWRFFTTRSPPASSPKWLNRPDDLPENVDLNTTGVESIHLIARSNCAFVNYASDPHLQHAISVSNDVALRPFDPRCKPLLCRVRKLTDDNKSGVGAQRQGGMHKAYVDNEKRKTSPELPRKDSSEAPLSPRGVLAQADSPDLNQSKGGHQNSISSSQGANSQSTASTTSSFLSQHFPKRFFVLKSHDEKELALSVEKGVWATQPHNEPVLDQAYRTCRDGVFLIFSANKSGEFYGYAKMAGPISGSEPTSLSSAAKKASNDNADGGEAENGKDHGLKVDTDVVDNSLKPSNGTGRLLSPSEERFALESPGKIEDEETVQNRNRGVSAPASIPFRDATGESLGAELVAANLALPDTRKAESLDPKLLTQMRNIEISEKAVKEQEALGSSMHGALKGTDGVWRKDTILSPEERNIRIELLEDEGKLNSKPAPTGWNNPFRVDWIKVERLPFSRTRAIKNGFNANREVKISRDGTEIEPAAGVALIEEFWKQANSPADTVTSHNQELPSPKVA